MIIEPEKVPYDAVKMNKDAAEALRNRINALRFEKRNEEQAENMRLLEECRGWWDSLYDFRKRRRRARRYHRGDQWSDRIENPEKEDEMISEAEYIKKQGKVPLKQNLIRQMMKNLVGQYRNGASRSHVVARNKEAQEGAEILSRALLHVQDLNFLSELDARALEEFALSGMVVNKQTFKSDVKVKLPNVNRMFFNTDIEDIRGVDIRIIGEIIDAPLDDIVTEFAKTPEDEEKIRELYTIVQKDKFFEYTGLDSSKIDRLDFYLPEDMSKARIYEVWQKKSRWRTRIHDYADGSLEIVNLSMEDIGLINQRRIEFGESNGIDRNEIPLIEAEPIKEQVWFVKYLTPHGHTLWEGETPYQHKEHPYTILTYPMIDGEVWGFVEDIIDQQRYINRMIILLDFIMSSSAKGVLMIPEDSIPRGMSPEDFAEEWRAFNGVITYKPSKHGQLPQQVTSNSTAVGLSDMLQFQMQFMNDISGLHGAIQGKEAKSGTPSSLYAQEAEHASTNTKDFFMSFNFFRQKRDDKNLRLIIQFYTEKRYLSIEGESLDEDKLYDPEKIEGGLYDIKVAHGVNTPAYRQMLNDTLVRLVENQMIDVKTYLENSPMPYSSDVLQSLEKRAKEAQQTGGAPQPGAVEGENKKAQPLLNRAIRQ